MAVGVAFTTPAFFTAVFSMVAPTERGSASGTASAFIDLAFGGGPMMAGFVAGAASIPTAFAVIAVLAFAGVAWTVRLSRRVRVVVDPIT